MLLINFDAPLTYEYHHKPTTETIEFSIENTLHSSILTQKRDFSKHRMDTSLHGPSQNALPFHIALTMAASSAAPAAATVSFLVMWARSCSPCAANPLDTEV